MLNVIRRIILKSLNINSIPIDVFSIEDISGTVIIIINNYDQLYAM